MSHTGSGAGPGLSDLRVAFFSDAIAERNGVGSYYRDLAAHLRFRLGAVALIAPGVEEGDGLCGPSIPMPGDPTQRIYSPRVRAAARQFRRTAPHIVVCATPGPFGILGAAVGLRCRLPLCVGYHTRYDQLVSLYWPPPFAQLGAFILQGWDRLTFRLASAVVANSAEMAENARRMGVSRIYRVSTPIARHLISESPAAFAGRIETVLFAGRLAAEKNIAHVLQAAEALRSIRFVIAGDGPLAGDVEQAASRLPNVTHLGWVARRRLSGVMDRCDLLVLPSKEEAFGTIALEAMARGRLVLVSARCGILNWPGLARSLFRIEHGETLVEAIRRIDGRGAGEKKDRAAAGRKAAEAFHQEAIEDWLRVFQRLRSPRACKAGP